MFQVDPEFVDKIPPLTEEEFQQLEENIVFEGVVLNPLVIWNNLIIDGHNRYKIIQKHPEVSYSVYEKEFPDRYVAIAWICKNQLGRRNLTPQQKKYLIGERHEAEKMAHGAADGFRGNQHSDENVVRGQFGVLPVKWTKKQFTKSSQRCGAVGPCEVRSPADGSQTHSAWLKLRSQR